MSHQTPIFESVNVNKYAYNRFSSTENSSQGVSDKSLLVLGMDNKYYCRDCNLSCTNIEEFEHHNLELHGQKKMITCTLCTATFRRQDHLKRHMQSLHYNQKYCTCPVCGRDLKRQDILLKHIQRKHATNNEVFHCRECSFECQSHSELEKHEFTHLLTERHVCQYCQATFKRRDHMLRHVKSQHLNQSILCPVCNQTYKRKDHVVRHVREKHKMGFLNGKLVTSKDMV